MAQSQAGNAGHLKILSIVWFKVLPPKFGGQKAVAFFHQHLAELAPFVSLCSKNNDAVAAHYQIINSLPTGKSQFLNPFIWQKIYRVAKRQGATHLLLEFPYHGIAAVLCKKLLGIKLIVHEHNVEALRFREQKKKWWPLLFRLERWTLRNADLVFFKTAQDMETAKGLFGLYNQKMSVSPYGVKEYKGPDKHAAQDIVCKRHGIAPHEKILLFAGTLDYAPNADAVVALTEQLIPLLREQSVAYKIIVCGRNKLDEFSFLKRLQYDQLIMAGEVEDIDLYFAAADVFLNPVLSGGGVQTKTLDALAHHLNVVCFLSKNAGIENSGNKVSAVGDGDWPAFAKAVLATLAMNEPTPNAFFETCNWRSIAGRAFTQIAAC